MHQWPGSSLVQVMAWRLFDAKPLPEPMLPYCQLDFWEQITYNLHQNSIIFIQENVFENVVWKMAAILSRPQCVNTAQAVSSELELQSEFWISLSVKIYQYMQYKAYDHILSHYLNLLYHEP